MIVLLFVFLEGTVAFPPWGELALWRNDAWRWKRYDSFFPWALLVVWRCNAQMSLSQRLAVRHIYLHAIVDSLILRSHVGSQGVHSHMTTTKKSYVSFWLYIYKSPLEYNNSINPHIKLYIIHIFSISTHMQVLSLGSLDFFPCSYGGKIIEHRSALTALKRDVFVCVCVFEWPMWGNAS